MATVTTVTICLPVLLSRSAVAPTSAASTNHRSWAADNGNGTYSNPLFYDEFSDPDMIRVGSDYYLTGTTMHAMPGLPILHSRDLVNWRWIAYAFDRLDLGPGFRLEEGQEIYGQGIWAPRFRYHEGSYYIFANVNRFGLQVFRASDPRGPWKHNRIDRTLRDLSVLFDDNGKIYAVYGARTIHVVELNAQLTDIVQGTDRVLIGPELGMGEGSHIYKLRGLYYIVSAIPGAHVPMKCARAERLEGPWEVKTISEGESLGIGQSYRFRTQRQYAPPFEILAPNPAESASLTLHQGGIIDTLSGEWWGFSMQDHNSVGRLTSLSPVTWVDDWPYFGLPGNLTRSPSVWVKPNTGHVEPVSSPYDRSDDFSKPKLQPVWQWNHLPDDSKWSLKERPGYLRLHSLPASDFWWARNSLTQRAIGPESTATTALDTAGMKPGDVAGLALLNLPYAWIGVKRDGDGLSLEQFDKAIGKSIRERLNQRRVRLCVHCDFDTDIAQFSYSLDGVEFKPFAGELKLVFQLKTFQGVRYALFQYNTGDSPGGQEDFDNFLVDEPRARGLTKAIPYGSYIEFESLSNGNRLTLAGETAQSIREADRATAFRVVDRGGARVALQTKAGQYLTVKGSGKAGEVGEVGVTNGKPGDAETFQWVDLLRGDTLLLSLATHRYILAPNIPGPIAADHPGPAADRKDGSCFKWEVVTRRRSR